MRTPPFTIQMALHFYYTSEPFPDLHTSAGQSVARDLLEWGIIDHADGSETQQSGLKITDKGKAWVEMICATPLPVQVWIHPDKSIV